ncbi:class I mannose-6-phosphate isomerase [Crossiella cryophila]|uniref:Mannose-6-phosphate isomerase n=1 Tax=Crossiella cryophila TaxID=43355 RepID=A0A7W7CJS5_9PSEU|nr:class I mannose-6-phosphate isomerase [Crossiella cryophila]MBB4682262.1 mannose-6-phosphate isomerase [Crossiella cryophila]
MKPVLLEANQPERFYRGGAAIAELRGAVNAAEWGPEDWVASTTTLFGQHTAGLAALPGGELLRSAIEAAPEAWLGAEHVAEFGANPALLVKLLDAGQRLPVHCHPSDSFAASHLDCRFGKTEAWVVVGTTGADPVVYVGFREGVDEATVAAWVASQDTSTMLHALNEVPVKAGDTVFVPAGLPHAIGAGVFIVELQQPTDFSVLLEWTGFAEEGDSSVHLGLGFEAALGCVDRSGWAAKRLDGLVRHTADQRGPSVDLLGEQSLEFFRADRVHTESPVEFDPGFAVLVALEGSGGLSTQTGGSLELVRGNTVVLPHAAGSCRVDGDLVLVRCRPPIVGGSTS